MVGEPAVPRIEVGGFDAVDAGADPAAFATWMAHQRAHQPDHALAPLRLQPGERLLDVGCGTGVDLAAGATVTGWAVGLDRSATMAASAVATATTHGLGGRALDGTAARVTVVVGDGQRLPFGTASFDAASARAVLIHTPAPGRTVAELRRVLVPGGRVVLSEPDHGSHLVATDELDVFERITAHRRTTFRHPLVGRALPSLAVDAGLTVTGCWTTPIVHRSYGTARAAGGPFGVAVDRAVAAGAITADEADRYDASLRDLDARGAFLFVAQAIVLTATST